MATRVSSLAAQIEVIGADKVKAALRELGVEGEHTANRLQTHYGKAARSLSLVTNEAVRAGEIGGNALQKLLVVGGDMAGVFGAGGAVVGALAVTGLAIFSYFDRARKQIEETAKTARATLRQLRDESASAGALDINRGVGGDALADTELGKRSLGQLQADKQKLLGSLTPVFSGSRAGSTTTMGTEDERASLAAINKEIEARNFLIQRGLPYVVANAEAEAHRTIEEGKAGLAAKASSDAQNALNLAIKRGQDASESAVRSILAKIAIQDQARDTQRKAGIAQPGDLTDMGAAASDTGGLLRGMKPKMDWDAWMTQMSQGADGIDAGLKSHTQEIGDKIKMTLATTLGDSIYAGFSAAFSGKGLSGIFKSFGKMALSGIGGIFKQQGEAYLTSGAVMAKFTPHLFNPLTSAWASLGIGAALLGLGSALGAIGGGSGGGGVGIGGAASIPRPAEITNIKLTATSVADQARYDGARPGNTYLIIGHDDPAAQRQLRDMVKNAERG